MRKGEVSAIQSAMNLYLRNPRGFKSEYQNEPEPEGGVVAGKELRADLVAARLSGLPRFEVPREATRLTAFIDCGTGLLWYAVVAWDPNFGGTVIDYGSWPRQARTVFENTDPRPGLKDKYPGMVETQWVYAGLADLTAEVLGRTYYREATGEMMRIERCLIDCGWLAQTVYQFCRASPFAPIIYPSKGIARSMTSRGVSEWKPRPGERSGFHWRLTVSDPGRGQQVQFAPDAWKTALCERLTTAAGGRGCLTLYGRSIAEHELIGLHCAAEYATQVTIRGASFDKWEIRPHRPDNHLLDCLVGASVAAGVSGLTWSASELLLPAAPRKKISLAAEYAAKHGKERMR
jgi:phage terminase large subunit GpA-like protein